MHERQPLGNKCERQANLLFLKCGDTKSVNRKSFAHFV